MAELVQVYKKEMDLKEAEALDNPNKDLDAPFRKLVELLKGYHFRLAVGDGDAMLQIRGCKKCGGDDRSLGAMSFPINHPNAFSMAITALVVSAGRELEKLKKADIEAAKEGSEKKEKKETHSSDGKVH